MKVLMKDRLVKLLKKQWITPLEALEQAGCMSLSQRCGDLRRDGINVMSKWLELPDGKRCKQYRIGSGPYIC